MSKNEKIRGKHPIEDVVYEQLVDAITDKNLRPGQHLNEVKLAEHYDVPRSRVRRVLERLRDEDVVVFELNKGAFISRPTVKEALSVFEVRRHLEVLIIRLACERANAVDIAELRGDLHEEGDAYKLLRPDYNRVAARFHYRLARISGNSVLHKMYSQIIRRCILVQSVYEKTTSILCLTGEHGQIVDLVEKKDVAGAEKLMLHHIDHIVGSLDLSEQNRTAVEFYEFN